MFALKGCPRCIYDKRRERYEYEQRANPPQILSVCMSESSRIQLEAALNFHLSIVKKNSKSNNVILWAGNVNSSRKLNTDTILVSHHCFDELSTDKDEKQTNERNAQIP